MTTRAKSILTEPAAEKADHLVARGGTFKDVVSAGVLALARLPAEEREALIAEARGVKLPQTESAEALFQKRLETIVKKAVKDEIRHKKHLRQKHGKPGKPQGR